MNQTHDYSQGDRNIIPQDMLEEDGIVSTSNNAGKRSVLKEK